MKRTIPVFNEMIYIFDDILERMVYTIFTENIDLDKAVEVAEQMKQLDDATLVYLLNRMDAWRNDRKDRENAK